MNARNFYINLKDKNEIPEHDGIPFYTPEDMIWFANEFHKNAINTKVEHLFVLYSASNTSVVGDVLNSLKED